MMTDRERFDRVVAERDDARARLTTAETLLARVEPELVPHYDEAKRLSDKFGLGTVAKTTLIPDIRAALACPPPEEEK